MTDRLSIEVINAQALPQALARLEFVAKPALIAGHRMSLSAKRATRSTAQNSLMWSMLEDLAQQCTWAVDGSMVKLDAEDVKNILTASLKRHQRMARGVDGGLVVLGQSTSRMTVAEMAELITLGHAYGDSQGVRWSRTSLGRDVPEEAFA